MSEQSVIAFKPRECERYPGYFWCDTYPNVAVSRTGEVIRLISGTAALVGRVVRVKSNTGYRVTEAAKGKFTALQGLMCHVFYGPPPPNVRMNGVRVMCRFKDGGKHNFNIENLEWMLSTGSEAPVDPRNPITVESKEYPGFFVCDVFPSVGVSRIGEIIRVVGLGSSKGRRGFGDRDKHGYRSTFTINNEQGGDSRATRVHRIVNYAFNGPPTTNQHGEVQKLVNHKDGVKDNNVPDNLEWCTNRENIMDAGDKDYSVQKVIAVIVKDMATGIITEYTSLNWAGISNGFRLASDKMYPGHIAVAMGRWQVKLQSDARLPWLDRSYNGGHGNAAVVSHHWESGHKVVFTSPSEVKTIMMDKLNLTVDAGLLTQSMLQGKAVLWGPYYFTKIIEGDRGVYPTREQVIADTVSHTGRLVRERPVWWYKVTTGEVGSCTFTEMSVRVSGDLGWIASSTMPEGYRAYIRCKGDAPFRGYHIRELWQGKRLNYPPDPLAKLKQTHK